MSYSDYIIYLDESGDHNLRSIDPVYPVFVLSLCIVKKSDYRDIVVPRMMDLKFKHFGYDTVVLHSQKLRSRSKDPKGRLLLRDVSAFIEEIPITIVAAVIKKRALVDGYNYPSNPYELALLFCLERAFMHLKGLDQIAGITHIVAEARGKREDDALELEFRRLCAAGGTRASNNPLPFEIVFPKKAVNSAGLQLADLTAHPIGRHVAAPDQPNRAYDVVKEKLRSNPRGIVDGWGLKVFP